VFGDGSSASNSASLEGTTGPAIDLSGGAKYVNSDRHAVYVNLHAWQKAQKDLRKELGWPAITSSSFESLRVRAGAKELANH
jgi:hypothetical protein